MSGGRSRPAKQFTSVCRGPPPRASTLGLSSSPLGSRYRPPILKSQSACRLFSHKEQHSMANPKYLQRSASTGKITEVIATETGPAAEVVVSTTSGGTIDPTLLPVSGASSAVAGEGISAGAYVYIKVADSKLYNAVWASGGNQAIGFVLASYPTPPQTATYYDSGANTSLTSLTVGSRYYGDKTTAGGVVLTVPTGAGVLS